MKGDPPAAPAAFDTVTGYLSWDHDRLHGLVEKAARHVRDGKWRDAAGAYSEFERGLHRHMRDEEEVLFPIFEARTGIVEGPTAVMRAEHREIRQSLALMREGVDAEDAKTFQEGLSFLRSVLPEHNAKEEHVLYPTTDRVLAPAERQAVVARLRRG